jgi:hypothetical protein
MQLGKLDASQSAQELRCKTRNNAAQDRQWVTWEKQNSQRLELIIQRDDELWSIGRHDNAAGPFESPSIAEPVATIVAAERVRRAAGVPV